MTEAIGGIRFVVTYGNGAYTIQGANVYLNSPGMKYYLWSYKGYTDQYGVLNVPNVPVGTNKYMISKTGFTTATGSLQVYEGMTTVANIDMVQSLSLESLSTGNLSIVSNPPGACVYIDDIAQVISTPLTISDIPEGDHVLTLTKDGYEDYHTLATIISGQTITITADMTSL